MEKQILNFENGMEMMGGDAELYREIIETFLASNQYDQPHIEKLIAEGKAMEAGTLVHRLKGAAATLGGERLQEVCSNAERILRGKDEGDATPLLPLIAERYQEFIPELQKALQKLQ